MKAIKPEEMETLSYVMECARKEGFTKDFEMCEEKLVCKETDEVFQPEDLVILKTYRFEGISDPGDMSILYAMEAKSGTKGLFIDAYGTYASNEGPELAEFFKKIPIITRETEE